MANNVFSTDPLSAQLDKEEAALAAPRRAITKPGTEAPAASSDRTPLSAFEDVSRSSNVPVNILLAVAERRGSATAEQGLMRAKATGLRLGDRIKAGEDIAALIAEEMGSPEEADAVLKRAREIGAKLYPDAPKLGDNQGSVVGDTARQLGGSVVKGVGAAVEGIARGIEEAVVPYSARFTTDIDPETGKPTPRFDNTDTFIAKAGQAAGDVVRGWGEGIQSGVSEEGRKAMEDSAPDGDVFKPSTWTFGKNPSLRGYAMLAADVMGSLLPVVAASLIPGAAPGVVVGGAMGAGSAAETARDLIDQAAKDIDPATGKSRLEAESAYYREALARGASPAEALELTKEAGGRSAALLTAPVSALGGAATGAIVKGKLGQAIASRVPSAGMAGRVAGGAVVSGAEEGIQEAAETIAARYGTQAATGLDLSVTEGTFGDFILGALGGAPTGALAGIRPERRDDDTGTAPNPGAPAPTNPGTPPVSPASPAAGAVSPPTAPATPSPAPAAQPRERKSAAELQDMLQKRMTAIRAVGSDQTLPDGSVIPGRYFTTDERAEWNALKAADGNPEAIAALFGVELKGRMEAALDETTPQRFPQLKAGHQVEIISSDGEVFEGEYVGETDTAVTAIINGERFDIPLDEFDKGGSIAPLGQQPITLNSQSDEGDVIEDFDPLEDDRNFLSNYGFTMDPEDLQNDASDLGAGVGAMGTGLAAGFYDSMWKRVEEGRTDENGAPSPILQAAKIARERDPAALTRENFESFAQEIEAVPTGPERTAAIHGIIDRYAPPAQQTEADAFEGAAQQAEDSRQPSNMEPEAQPETPAAEAPKIEGGWTRSVTTMRRAAKAVGLTKADLGDAWGDKRALRGAVNERLKAQGFHDFVDEVPHDPRADRVEEIGKALEALGDDYGKRLQEMAEETRDGDVGPFLPQNLEAYEKRLAEWQAKAADSQQPSNMEPQAEAAATQQPSNTSTESPTGFDYPNRKLGFRYAASDVDGQPSMETGAFGAIALANMQPGDVIPGAGTVRKVTDKQIHIEGADGKLKRLSVDGEKFEALVRDVGGLVEASQHGAKAGNVLDAIKRDPAFSYVDGIPQLSDTVTGTKDRPNTSILKPLYTPGVTETTKPGTTATQQPSTPKGQGADPRADMDAFMATMPKAEDISGYYEPHPLNPSKTMLVIKVKTPKGTLTLDPVETSGQGEASFEAQTLIGSYSRYGAALERPWFLNSTLKHFGVSHEAYEGAAAEQPSTTATQQPSNPAPDAASDTKGQGARDSEPYMLMKSLPEKQARLAAKHRGSDLGELIGKLDDAARRMMSELRAQGLDLRDFDERGRDKTGNQNQWAHGIREAETLAHELTSLPGVDKRGGELVFPPFNEDTGEFEPADWEGEDGDGPLVAAEDHDEAALVFDALMWLDTVELMGTAVSDLSRAEVDEEAAENADTSLMPDDKLFVPREKGETITLDTQLENGPFVSPEDAAAIVAYWKQVAKEIGASGANKGKAVLSLFDYTGQWSQPWRDAGYKVLQLDIKTGHDVLRDQAWIMDQIEEARAEGVEFVGVLAATPCTTFTGTGARWRPTLHDLESPEALAKVFGPYAPASGAKSALEYNVMLVDATKDMVQVANPTGWHVLENPIGRIRDVANMPHALARVHPHNFGDPYTKGTQLFGTFEPDFPTANVFPAEGSKIQSKLRGTDPLGKEMRSTTPLGFSYAFFMANDPAARERLRGAPKPARTYDKAEAKALAEGADSQQPSNTAQDDAPGTGMTEQEARALALDLLRRFGADGTAGFEKDGTKFDMNAVDNILGPVRRKYHGKAAGKLFVQPPASRDAFVFSIAELQKELDTDSQQPSNKDGERDKTKSFADIDESSANDPKLPKGFNLLSVKRVTRQEAKEQGIEWPALTAIVNTTEGERALGVGTSTVSRAEAIAKAIDSALQTQARNTANSEEFRMQFEASETARKEREAREKAEREAWTPTPEEVAIADAFRAYDGRFFVGLDYYYRIPGQFRFVEPHYGSDDGAGGVSMAVLEYTEKGVKKRGESASARMSAKLGENGELLVRTHTEFKEPQWLPEDFDPKAFVKGVKEPGDWAKIRELAAPAPRTKPADSQQSSNTEPEAEAEPAGKIEDFGEKIGGARKDRARKLADLLAMETDVESVPLSQSFPVPDYEALAADGMETDRLALLAHIRGSIQRKPQGRYRAGSWADGVVERRRIAAGLISGEATVEGAREAFLGMETWHRADRAMRLDHKLAMLAALPVSYFAEASKLYVTPGFKRNETEPSYWTFHADAESWRDLGRADNTDPAALAEAARAWADKERAKRAGRGAGGRKALTEADLKVFYYTGKAERFIGFKGPRGTVELAGPFKNAAEARAYRDENAAELLEEAESLRDGPQERNDTNRERKGIERRKGNISPEAFQKAFGLKGVEFGNYVTQKERPDLLNRTYDALMDLAGALGVDPKMLSLGGTLGLGLGSRGTGGRNPAAAHYEPGYIAINLTRANGPGSLAHEWFHAFDNWAAKLSKGLTAPADVMASNGGLGAVGVASDKDQSLRGDGLLDDERTAFNTLRYALKRGPWFKRSENFDGARSKPYYATTVELAARAFEKMIKDRLAEHGMHNDFLVNTYEGSGIYPTTDELIESGARGAFEAVLHNLRERLATPDRGNVPRMDPRQPELRRPMPNVGDKFTAFIRGESVKAEITAFNPGRPGWTVTLEGRDVPSYFSNEGELLQLMTSDTAEAREKHAAEKAKIDADRAKSDKAAEDRSRRREAASAKVTEFAKARGWDETHTRTILIGKSYDFSNAGGVMSRAEKIMQLIEEGGTVKKAPNGKPDIHDARGNRPYGRATYTDKGVAFAAWYETQLAKEKAEAEITNAFDEAAKDVDPNPTDAQKEAGNYAKGHVAWEGLDLVIETAKGAERSGTDANGERWSVTMPAHYGDIKGTVGADGDPLDFYMGDMPGSDLVVIINQVDPDTGAFDEHKIMLGMGSTAQAWRIYAEGFSDGRGKDRIGSATAINVAGFKAWLENGDHTQPTEPVKAKPQATKAAPEQASDDELSAAFDAALDEVFGEETDSQQPSTPEPEATVTEPVTPASPEEAWDSASTAEREELLKTGGWAKADGTLSEAGARNLDRDWKDLTDTAKAKVKAGQGAARSAGEAAKSAASNAVQGFADLADAFTKLLGGGTTLNSGLTFDRERYEAAKPLFREGLKRLGMAGADIKDMMVALIRELQGAGLGREQVAQLKPLATQFIKDVQAGEIDLSDEAATVTAQQETTNDAGPDHGNSADALEGAPREGNREPDAGSAPSAGGRGGRSGSGGNGSAGTDRGGSLDSLGGRAEHDGSDRPAGDRGLTPPTRSGQNPGNFIITDDFALGEGTDGQKLAANLAAIRLVKQLDAENRFATPEEQAVLARYVGWGGLRGAFDVKSEGTSDQWGRAYAELKELLTPEEWHAAFMSTRNAHYTAREVVGAMWDAMAHVGFKGGRALEPTVGSGNFLGLQPEALAAATEWHAAELDSITGRITKHLYPAANVLAGTGFEKAPFADGVFDVAIGNPPFGSNTASDPLRPDLDGMKIHNYIIAKTGLHLRPGGVMGMVVTHRFLDTADPEGRAELAKRFKFLGAVRLPNDAFAKNANTSVVTDIVFLQKLKEGETAEKGAAWLDTNGALEGGIRVNRYYQENPGNILGRSAMDGEMYAHRNKGGDREEYTVHSDGRDLAAELPEALRTALADAAGALGTRSEALDAVSVEVAVSDMPFGGMRLIDGKVMMRVDNDAQGGAVIEELTATSPWADDADAYGKLFSLASMLRDMGKRGLTPEHGMIESFQIAATTTLKVDGSRKDSPTKAEQAVYGILDALANPERFNWRDTEALGEIKTALERKQLGEPRLEKLRAMLHLRALNADLIERERRDATGLEKLRKELNAAYDAFQKAHGYLTDPANAALLRGDADLILGLEVDYTPRQPAQKADPALGLAAKAATPSSAKKNTIFEKRVFFPHKPVDRADNPHDGLAISLSERGKLDLPYIAKLTGQTTREVIDALTAGENPAIFFDPETEAYVEADAYLSGNVKAKLAEAKAKGIAANVRALEEKQPADLPQDRITPSIRSQWVPREVFSTFLRQLGYAEASVTLLPEIGLMTASARSFAETDLGRQFVDPDKTVLELFNAASQGKALRVMRPDGDGGTYEDKEASKRVTALSERLGKTFEEWVYMDERRAEEVVKAYNEKMNTHRPRKYDGRKYLKTVGANPAISLRRTQKDAAWRMMQSKAVLLDHVVGAGKTFTVITGVMERKRLGLSKKPMIVVPNHLVLQWAQDFYKLYPGARILAATPDDFAAKNRRRLFARAASGDFDAIIVGHSSLSFIETPANDLRALITEKVEELRSGLNEARRQGESGRTLTQIANRIEKYEAKLAALSDQRRDEIGVDFESMGIDYLAVDESQEFKNLEYLSTGERVVGMNDPKGSKKAFDLYAKMRGLIERGGSVAFATGTPVSNSLVELFTVMSYLAHAELKKRNQHNYDAWASSYAMTETRMEYTATQKLKPRRVLSGLSNLTSLGQLYEQFADIITMDTLKRLYTEEKEAANKANGTNERTDFPVPKVKGGGRQLDSAPLTDQQQEYLDYLVARMQAIEANKSDKEYPKKDNPLWVLSDARKMSLDIRTVDPTAPRDEGGKVARSAERIKATYDAWAADRGTQMVFCDLSTPSKGAAKEAGKMIRDLFKVALGERQGAEAAKRVKDKSYREQWDAAMSAADAVMEADTDGADTDRIEDFLAKIEDAEASMSVADVGFSVYDDLRALLVEKGIPRGEIAFIHDYNTPEQKSRLFAAMNRGEIRVLMGSSPKMGAGTNAQKKLVALHHLDAPWRPSDVEQREGRIIRQGNDFYQRDPDGFEVEIVSYSTEGSSDTVFWQILERKAAGIEQFRSLSADSVSEEEGDSDQYAEFMASSTGNPVFKYKLEAERDVAERNAEISGLLMARSSARSYVAEYPERRSLLTSRLDALDAAELGALTYAGQSADPEGYAPAMQAAQEAYEAAYAEWMDNIATIDSRVEELNRRGVTDPDKIAEQLKKDGLKRSAKPAEPGPLNPAVVKASPYAAMIRTILEAAGNMKTSIGDVRFKAGGMEMVISREVAGFTTDTTIGNFTLKARLGPVVLLIERFQGKNPVESAKFARALLPDRLKEWRDEEIRYRRETLTQIDADLPKQRKIAETVVDERPRDEARARLRWYEIAVRFAEGRADEARAARANAYIAADTKRPLSTARSELQKRAPEQFEVGGELYETTGDMVRAGGGFAMEAKRVEGGTPAVLLAKFEKGADTLTVDEAMPMPEGARQMRKGVRSFLRRRRASRDERVAAFLTDRLADMGLSDKVTFQLIEAFREVIDGKKFVTEGWQHLDVLAVALDAADPNFALHHEALHAFRRPQLWNNRPYGIFTRDEWVALVASARSDKRRMKAAKRDYGHVDEAAQIEEVIANQFAEWMRTGRPMGSKVGRAFLRFRGILGAIRDALFFAGISRRNEIFRGLESGEFARRLHPDLAGPKRVPLLNKNGGINPQALLSRREDSALVGKLVDAAVKRAAKLPGKAKELAEEGRYRASKEGVSNALTDAMGGKYSILGLVPGRALFAELGKAIPAANRYLSVKGEMDALRNQWHDRTARVAEEWHRLIQTDPKANERLMDLMHRSTIAGVDPSKGFRPKATDWHAKAAKDMKTGIDARASAQAALDEDARREGVHNALKDEFDALPGAFQQLYRTVRDSYGALANAYEDALLDNMRKSADRAVKEANRTYKKEVRDIEDDDNLTVDEQVEALQRAKEKLEKAESRSGWARKAKIAGLRAQFEMNRLKGPYFPLSRFGNYFVTLRNRDGELESFSLFETVREQKEFIAEKEAEGFTVFSGVMSNAKEMKGAIDPRFVAQVEEILGDADVPNKVMDEVWQKYLETLPDLSIRTNRIHRKARRGYVEDAYRAFAKKVFHGSHQLARLTYASDLEDALNDARDQAAASKDPNRNGHIVNEMARRHEFTMNPTGSELISKATTGAFLWYLAVSPAAAMVNVSQTTVIGVPILGAAFEKQGVTEAAKAIGKAMAEFGRGKGHIRNSKKLARGERYALSEAYRRGVIDRTQSHDLAQIGETGVAFNETRHRWMKRFSWLFHQAEVFNREVTYLAAYRMAVADGLTDEAAIDKAAELTWKIHFDYQNTSRPRVMQGDTAKLLTVFRNYSVNAIYRLVRDAHQSMHGATEADRREARRQLIGITASMALHAGIKGTWGFGLVMSILAMATGEDDDELEQKLNALLVGDGESALRKYVAGLMLNGVPGHVLGISLSERIGMPDLWFRDSGQDLEGKDQWVYWLEQAAGPAIGIGGTLMAGYQNVLDGNVQRGIEGSLPKFGKDMMRAYRFATEGVETWKGDPIIEELGYGQILAQALGFTPAEVAEKYAANSALKGAEIRLEDRRSKLLAELREAVIAGKGITPALQERWAEWNREVPEHPITGDTLKSSIDSRRRSMLRNEGGVQINPKLNDRLRREIAKPIYQ